MPANYFAGIFFIKSTCTTKKNIYNRARGLVAQWLERSAHNALVVGSSPT